MNLRIRQFLHDEWVQLLVLLIPLIAALSAMPFATEHVPMQWNLHGQVNWYAPKEWGLLLLPGFMAVIFGIVFWLEARDRYRFSEGDGSLTSHGKATRTIRLAISLLMGGICFLQIACALGRHPDVGRLLAASLPLMLAFAGNLFGKLKPNRYMGIRVPWTLRSEAVWRTTHRAAGWMYTVSGLIVAGLALVVPASYLPTITLIWIGIIVIAPLLVAWKAARDEGTPPANPPVQRLSWKVTIEIAVLVILFIGYLQHLITQQAKKSTPPAKAATTK